MLQFPPNFVWGTATAAYQVEGAAQEDGRTASIWDTFSATPGKVLNGDTGLIACDHYHRLDEDLDLLVDLGVQAYRFSVSWPRLIDDSCQVNPLGADFYRRLATGLRSRGIRPLVTLYHWDLPQRLEDRGGWTNREIAHEFAEYAVIVQDLLRGLVDEFTTFNEPWVSAFLGYGIGLHAPGRSDTAAFLSATHHLLLAHGLALQALRAADPATKVGITLNLSPAVAISDRQADRDAAVRLDGQQNRLFLDPLLRGEYPKDVVDLYRPVSDWSFIQDGDLALISAPLDHLGVNYYRPHLVVDEPESTDSVRAGVRLPDDVEVTTMGWPVQPEGLTDLLVRLRDDYRPVPLYITENGAAFADVVGADGTVEDPRRVEFLRGHLQAAHAALQAGVDLRGYFVWSFLDNFEWSLGYSQRFGLIYVDYRNLQRIPKTSAAWYAQVIRAGGVSPR